MILQETHSTPEIEKIWENEWGGKAVFAHGTSGARGVAMFMTKEIHQQLKNIYTDLEGRVIISDLHKNGTILTIVALYAPNQDNPEFFGKIQKELRNRSEHKLIIGDFNLALDLEMDRENTYNNNNKARDEVCNLCDKFFMKDIWRVQNETRREFSWMKKGSYPIKASRIDLALVSGGIDQRVEMVQYLSSVFTDHRAIYLVIQLEPSERGRGYWKLQ